MEAPLPPPLRCLSLSLLPLCSIPPPMPLFGHFHLAWQMYLERTEHKADYVEFTRLLDRPRLHCRVLFMCDTLDRPLYISPSLFRVEAELICRLVSLGLLLHLHFKWCCQLFTMPLECSICRLCSQWSVITWSRRLSTAAMRRKRNSRKKRKNCKQKFELNLRLRVKYLPSNRSVKLSLPRPFIW